jgi:hypothetical protein
LEPPLKAPEKEESLDSGTQPKKKEATIKLTDEQRSELKKHFGQDMKGLSLTLSEEAGSTSQLKFEARGYNLSG